MGSKNKNQNINKLKTKQERLDIVLNIVKQLKEFPKSHPSQGEIPFVNLYNIEYGAIRELKDIFTRYVQQDDSKPKELIGFSGKIYFEEINRYIEYILPIKKHNQYILSLNYL
jgi:CCR4-NOT transcriptional regulation complex NOT5 subunit